MSDSNDCPLCGYQFFSGSCKHTYLDIAAEIARLRAELEKAQDETLDIMAAEAHTAYERDSLRSELTNNQELLSWAVKEVSRLRSALSQDEKEIIMDHKRMRKLTEECDEAIYRVDVLHGVIKLAGDDCREARKWAKYYQRRYLNLIRKGVICDDSA